MSELSSGRRLDALGRTGLDAASDAMFDRFAEMVRTVLNVPVSLVSLVTADRQIFPGACGLADPWAQDRETPLSHSFCQHVVASASPLVVVDARKDPRVQDNLAIEDLGVIGYAGMPLTDAEGQVLGSLCAIDQVPRDWTERELSLLRDLAAACSDSLRLRIASHDVAASFARSRLLLSAASALAATTTLDDVATTVHELVTTMLDPAYVGISELAPGREVVLASAQYLPSHLGERWSRYSEDVRTPSALAASTGEVVLLPDLAAVAARTPDALSTFHELGWQAAASWPLPGPRGPIGSLTFVWKRPFDLNADQQAMLGALAGYVAHAVTRAGVLDDRRTAAATMQKALLTPLPRCEPVQMAARYAPAHHENHVGGDWYDAIAFDGGRLALVIGDVVGHSVEAAATMSQYRSTLRTLIVDRQESPSWVLRRLERTGMALGTSGLATVLLAYLDPAPTGGYDLTWSNAGHPPPTHVSSGTARMLSGTDPLIGLGRDLARRDHSARLPAGSRLLLHTDGLVESRTMPVDLGLERLGEMLTRHVDTPLEELADLLIETAVAQGHDDVALLLVATPDT
ncbi:GAF domain-containing SpoIIE family protein phosphatase [Cryptosporangium arvum]|uniref:GAF domain-containing SpoIIE family protein phosphatase n=1 Tax=Cryptosporangium arvum TaxID=80871 RepID=UPI0004B4E48A|nr:SpoIIE family protein phosphatase [Cryptosporangium arvum]